MLLELVGGGCGGDLSVVGVAREAGRLFLFLALVLLFLLLGFFYLHFLPVLHIRTSSERRRRRRQGLLPPPTRAGPALLLLLLLLPKGEMDGVTVLCFLVGGLVGEFDLGWVGGWVEEGKAV